MKMMIRTPIFVAALLALTVAAQAQIAPPPVPSIVPPPSAPPPPRIEVPEVPKMDAPRQQPKALQQRRSSFNDRVINCLDDAYAARLAPGDRVAYSRGCANRTD